MVFYLNNALFNCIRNSLTAQTYTASDFSPKTIMSLKFLSVPVNKI